MDTSTGTILHIRITSSENRLLLLFMHEIYVFHHLLCPPGTWGFTRNRTHGSDFSSFFLRAWEVPDIVPCCFRVRISQRERSVLGNCTDTLSREADQFLGLAGAVGC